MLLETDDKSVQELLHDRQAHSALMRTHLARAQNRIKLQADK
jgi:hypothetical protein